MGKVLAVGDIHTKIWIVEKVAKLVGDYDKIVFCGDYADDFYAGPQDTLETWKCLRDLKIKYQGKVELVMGNHDYIYVNDTPSLQSGYNSTTQFLISMPENKDLRVKWSTYTIQHNRFNKIQSGVVNVVHKPSGYLSVCNPKYTLAGVWLSRLECGRLWL